MYRYKERLRLYKRWPCSTYILNRINWRECSVTWSAIFLSHINHVSVSPTDGTWTLVHVVLLQPLHLCPSHCLAHASRSFLLSVVVPSLTHLCTHGIHECTISPLKRILQGMPFYICNSTVRRSKVTTNLLRFSYRQSFDYGDGDLLWFVIFENHWGAFLVLQYCTTV